MQAIELAAEIDHNQQIHLQLPKSIHAHKAKVIVMYEEEIEQPLKPLTLGLFKGKIQLSDDFTKQPPAKAGGFELRTGSPDTRRLNDAYYGGSILNSSFGLGSK